MSPAPPGRAEGRGGLSGPGGGGAGPARPLRCGEALAGIDTGVGLGLGARERVTGEGPWLRCCGEPRGVVLPV